MKTAAILAAALALAGCAASPSSIQPIAMGNAYTGVDCSRVVADRNAAAKALAALEEQQRVARTGDIIGVLFVGIPTASLTGSDVSGAIGAEKGRIIALDARLLECSEVAS